MISKEFILGGDATFTIATPNGHRTYNVRKVEGNDRWPEAYFVSLLTGPDNTNDYTYIGKLDTFYGVCNTTAKSKHHDGTFPLRLLNRVLARIWGDEAGVIEKAGFAVHHEGMCGRCGRKLTVPSSVESGFGPECSKLIGGAA